MKTVRKLQEIVAIQTMLYTVKRVRDSDHCLTQSEQIYHVRTSYIRWGGDVCFVLNQHV